MAKRVLNRRDLEMRILELKQVHEQQIIGIKASAAGIIDSFSLSNILKSALKDVVHSPDTRNKVMSTAIGIGAGFLGKKIYVGHSKNIFKNIAGITFEFLIANFVRRKIPGMMENNAQHDHQN